MSGRTLRQEVTVGGHEVSIGIQRVTSLERKGQPSGKESSNRSDVLRQEVTVGREEVKVCGWKHSGPDIYIRIKLQHFWRRLWRDVISTTFASYPKTTSLKMQHLKSKEIKQRFGNLNR